MNKIISFFVAPVLWILLYLIFAADDRSAGLSSRQIAFNVYKWRMNKE